MGSEQLTDVPVDQSCYSCGAGYNIVDVLVGGSQGHVVGIGAILGLKALGAL